MGYNFMIILQSAIENESFTGSLEMLEVAV